MKESKSRYKTILNILSDLVFKELEKEELVIEGCPSEQQETGCISEAY